MFQDRETSLLRCAARLQQGDTTAEGDIARELEGISAHDWKLARSIEGILKIPNKTAQLYGLLALGRMGEAANGQVQSIAQIMSQGSSGVASVAMHALVNIGTTDALNAIKTWIDSRPPADVAYVSASLEQLGEKGESFLESLERVAKALASEPELKALVNVAIQGIQTALRHQHAITMPMIRDESRVVDLDTRANLTSLPDRSHELRSGHLDERFHFNADGLPGELRIEIHRAQDGRFHVALISDMHSYGLSPTNGAERFATALTEIYALDPERTTWVEHYDRSWGTSNDSTSAISFTWNPTNRQLSDPQWRGLPSLQASLAAWRQGDSGPSRPA